MLTYAVQVILMILTLLVVVPAATGGDVAIRHGGFFRGLIALFGISIINSLLWFVFSVLSLGTVILANILFFGLIGIMINALAFSLCAQLLPETLRVRSFGSACWASVIMMVFSYFITKIVI